jgi:CxxC-x17-CxxC domain-containing protein
MGYDGSGFGPRQMYKAVCADCGKECEVPFKPAEGRPVYCRDCYSKHKKF